MSQFEGRDQGARQPSDLQAEPVDPRAYLRPVVRWKWVILAIAILAAGVTYALTSHEQKTYTATSLVEVQTADPAAPSINPPTTQQLQDVATLFTDRAITNTVYSDLRLPIGSAGSVVVSPSSTSDFVDVTASSHSAALAASLANTYVSVFLASQAHAAALADQAAAAAATATLNALPNTTANQSQRQELIATIAADNVAARNPSPGATAPDPASVPKFPSSPEPKKDALFAGIIGLLLGIGLAFILDLADRRLVRVSSVESIYGRSVLAVLPHVANPAPRDHGTFLTPPEFIEVMRSLRVNLRLAVTSTPLKSILVTSALPSEGKSTVVRDLAFAYADAGERVLVIDGDLRRPSLATVFGVTPALGLVHVLRGEASPAEAAVTVFRTNPGSSNGSAGKPLTAGDPRVHGSISLLAHGEQVDSPAALLSSSAMTELVATASAQYDVVILDTSPILTVSDAVPLLDQVSAVLFVARLGMTTREAAGRLTELGQRASSMNLVGVVVNDMRGGSDHEGYGYYSQFGYTYAHPEAAPAELAAKVYEPLLQNGARQANGLAEPGTEVPMPRATSDPYDPTSAYDPASPYDPAV